ncbi:MAG: ATP-binding protein [bacterium]|nr:ATP-binding protein [bacterium]
MVYFFNFAPIAQAAIPVTITSPASGSVIRSSTVTITGTTAPNYTLYLSMDGGPSIATPANSFGNWSQTFTQLKSGSHSLSVSVTGGPFAYFTNNQALGGGPSQNTVSVVDASTNLKVNTVNVGNFPGGIAISPDGTKVYVANFADSTISIINTSNDQIIGIIPISPGSIFITGLAIHPNGQYLYVGSIIGFGSGGTSEVKIVSLSSNSVIGSSGSLKTASTHGPPANPAPFGVSITPDGSKLFTGNLFDSSLGIINVSGGGSALSEDAVSPIAVDGGTFESGSDIVIYAGVNPAGTKVYISQFNSSGPIGNNLYVLDIASNSLCTGALVPPPTCVLGATYPITHPSFVQPIFAKPTPDGSKVYLSNSYFSTAPSLGTVSVISTATDSVTSAFGVGANPTSIGYLGTKAYVANTVGTNISVINIPTDSVVATINDVPGAFTLGDFVGQKVTNQVIDFSNGSGLGFTFEIPAGFGFNENPIIFNALPQNVLPNLREVPSGIDNSILGQFIQALKNTPVAIAYSFPYLLFVLLGILLLILIWQTRQEVGKVYILRKTLEKEKNIAQEKDDFLIISSHYLRTPAAIINWGIDELRRSVAAASTTIVGLSASAIIVSNRVKKLTEDVNNNTFLKNIEQPDIKNETIQAFSSPYFLLPIISVGMLAILANLLFVGVGKISPSIVNFLTQAMIFIIIAVLIYVFIRKRYLGRQQRENYEKTVNYQRVLDTARNDFIDSTKNDLELEVDKMKEIITSSKDKKVLRHVADGVKRLSSILAKFNILALIESGQTKRIAREIDLTKAIDDIVTKHDTDIKKKQLKVQILGDKILAHQDPVKLAFVLDSLIDNAIRFNKVRGSLIITQSRQDNAISVSVEDTGIGIKKADLVHIFKPFSRVGPSLEFNYEGMGISLFINKIIMNYLGGDILVESVHAKGTKTTIAFGDVTENEPVTSISWSQAPSFGK